MAQAKYDNHCKPFFKSLHILTLPLCFIYGCLRHIIKFVKLFTQNFPYYLASFIFSSFCVHLIFVTKGFFFRVKYIQNKNIYFFCQILISLIIVFRVINLCIFTENVTMLLSVIGSTTYQIIFFSIK